MADGKFSNRSNRDADGFSLQLIDKPSEDIIVGSLTTGYYPLTAKNITGTMSASTIGRFSSATATDSTAIVGRMIAAASSGGGLSTTANYTGTPTVTITPTADSVGGTVVTEANKGTYYVKIVADSQKLTGTTTVKRAAFSATTAGYQPKGTLLSEGSQTASVTVNSGTSTKYINIPAGSCKVSGGGLSGNDVTPEIKLRLNAQTTSGVGITDDQPSSGYYLTIGGSSTKTTASVTRAAITDEHTAGYIPAKTATTVISSETKTLNINSGKATSYITIPAGSCTVAGGELTLGTASGGGLSGGGLSVTDNKTSITPTVSVTLSAQTTSGVDITNDEPSSGYYLTINGSSSSDSAVVNRAKIERADFSQKVTRAAITDAHTAGYIPAKSATTVINSGSTTVTLSAGSIAAASQTITVNAGSKTRYITIPSAIYANGFVNSAGYIPKGTNVYTTAQTDECITINFN